jgi:ribosomal protein S18 acetylase RimI-like enzyme
VPLSLDSTFVEEAIRFAEAHPWQPAWPAGLIRRFLTQLISSEKLVLESLDSKGERLVLGVLLDRVNNPVNHACLEIIGLRTGGDLEARLEPILELAWSRLPANRSGLQFGAHESVVFGREWLARNGLVSYYDTFEMVNSNPALLPKSQCMGIEAVKSEDLENLYSATRECFKDNPDTSIPEYQEWRSHRLTDRTSELWVHKENGKILGFINLVIEPGSSGGEVRTLGVLPSARRRGLGRAMLTYALNRVVAAGLSRCVLTVAGQNEKALDLYRSLGFEVTDRCCVYSRDR